MPSPFDADGYMREQNTLNIVNAGKFMAPLYDMKRAAQYSKICTATSQRAYNGSTQIGSNFLTTGFSDKKLGSFDNAILVVMSSGGDFQDDGSVSTPVQLGYVLKNGKIVGKAPQIILNNSIEKIFGMDYIGTLKERMYRNTPLNYFAAKMNVKKG